MLTSYQERRRQEAVKPRPPNEDYGRVSVRGAAEIGGVVDAVVAAMGAAAYPDKDRFAVRLALDEAVANAVRQTATGATPRNGSGSATRCGPTACSWRWRIRARASTRSGCPTLSTRRTSTSLPTRLALDAVLCDVAALQRAGQPRHPVQSPLRFKERSPVSRKQPEPAAQWVRHPEVLNYDEMPPSLGHHHRRDSRIGPRSGVGSGGAGPPDAVRPRAIASVWA